NVVFAVLNALGGLEGLRLAEPGEFTRRAFENDKMDLTAAEAIADLVDAETDAQRRQALRQMGGSLGDLYEGWRGRLVRALAHAETDIDFGEEEALSDAVLAAVRPELQSLLGELESHLADGHRGERLRDGLYVAIIGAPNVGKSSLLNALARRDAAIVSETAGTTRDVIEVHLDLGGYPATVADTAGLRRAADAIEDEGIRRAEARAEIADIRVIMTDARTWPEIPGDVSARLDKDSVLVVNKTDLRAVQPEAAAAGAVCAVSVKTGQGMDGLEETLRRMVAARLEGGGGPAPTRRRHREALEQCGEALRRALVAEEAELLAEDSRLAMRHLGRITGKVDVEDLLDIVFRDFCIGK
ncbi:MAG: tRNA uridine-5-carboxymethylaminomethyl(34) synthesis GTPase MnmE, partial [Minwuiales bacterium]|nr:tRNA uridine-5-carboxymethylaminomethyl(34) synthesis GTPase MnmE [Minwuiales bacterium]